MCNSIYFWLPSESNAWFPSERHQNLLHHPQLSFNTGAFVIHTHLQALLSAHRVSSLYLWASPCVRVCLCCNLYPHVLCVYMYVTELGVYACSLSSGVPNWLWHICGFSRQSRTGAKLPRNQCNRLRSPPFSSCSPLSLNLTLPPPPPLSLSVCVVFLHFSPSVLLGALIKNGVSVCCIFKWSWMDLNGWWYLVSPQGAAMSP